MIGKPGGKSAGDVAAEIAMSRLNWPGSFLVVEGPSDSCFWRPRKSANCDVVIATGRSQLLGAAQLIAKSGIDGVLGIVDDDFDTLLGRPHGIANVLSTEPRDLEGMLLRSGALDKVLAEYADTHMVDRFIRQEPPSIQDALLKRAAIFGKVHLVNFQSPSPVGLIKLRPPRFRCANSWAYDETLILSEAVRLGVAPDVLTLKRDISQLPDIPLWQLCRGHDLLLILGDGLKTALGSRAVGEDALSICLRSGYEKGDLRSSKVWADISAWESTNAPYEILEGK